MKKLENITKKEIFNVPDGYFDKLPGKIQARISAGIPGKETNFVFRYKLQFALAVPIVIGIALLAVGINSYTSNQQPGDVESILASIQTEDLITYLDESGLTTDDLLENIEFDAIDLEAIENEVYDLNLEAEGLDELADDLESENI
jgi:hypothetical protein